MPRLALAPVLAALPALACAQVEQGPANADFEPAFENQTRAPALETVPVEVSSFVDGLVHPWGIDTLPSGGWLVTERPGRLRMVSPDGTLSEPVSGVPEVDAREQGGLLDVTVGPDFETDRMVYLTYAKMVDGGTVTAAARGRLTEDGTALENVEDIFVQEPPSSSPMHYGSRILFGPEGHAWITTGEHFSDADRQLAQDLGTTYGKVIRINADGTVPEDNPFVGEEGVDTIWSYGHRNIQGAAFGPDGDLWTIEHGPAGGDELNLTEAGENYGWPLVSYGVRYDGGPIGTGDARAEGIAEPVYYWDPVIAPGGMTFYEADAFPEWQGDLLIASLVPGALVRLDLEDGRVVGEARNVTDQGRIRDVEVAPNGEVLLLVDSEDGAILRVSPAETAG